MQDSNSRFRNTCNFIKLVDIRLVGNKRRRFANFNCFHCHKEFDAVYEINRFPKSCGCVIGTPTHGETLTRLYKVYSYMKTRCYRKKGKDYKNYGGRGITVCDEWKNDFVAFRDWARDNGYRKGLQLDRTNNNGNYEPSNCRFVSHTINNQNRRDNKLTPIKVNEIRSLYKLGLATPTILAERYNVSTSTIYDVVVKRTWRNI